MFLFYEKSRLDFFETLSFEIDLIKNVFEYEACSKCFSNPQPLQVNAQRHVIEF